MNKQSLLVPIREAAGRQRTPWFLVLYLAAGVATASAQGVSTAPNVEAIVAHMAQARAENRARFRPYTVTRDYKLFGKERHHPKSQVTADIAFAPHTS